MISAQRSLRVGLTGGIASGKSTVGKIMKGLGCLVTDADELVADLYLPGAKGAQAVANRFGPTFLTPRGSVNKEKLTDLVFGDANARRNLEKLIHPLVALRFAELTAEHEGIVVFEATLLVEGGGYRGFDRLITVEADTALRLQRAIHRGLGESEAIARMQAQATQEERVTVADFVISNEGTLEELRARTEEVVAALFEELKLEEPSDPPEHAKPGHDDSSGL